MARFGVIVPEHIDRQVDCLRSQLMECLPYQDESHPENVNLLDVGIEVGQELVRFCTAIKSSREGE